MTREGISNTRSTIDRDGWPDAKQCARQCPPLQRLRQTAYIQVARFTYFAGWGLAEQARWLLAATGVDFEQVVLTTHAAFDALRKRDGHLMFQQIPLLEIDGLRLVQSQAIVRYVGRRGGLQGNGAAEEAKVDMVSEGIKDCRSVLVSYPFQKDKPAFLAELPAKLAKYLPALEAALVEFDDGAVSVVPSGLSTADVLLAELVEGLQGIAPECQSEYPKVAKVHKRVLALPAMKIYLASDKRFPFPTPGKVCDTYVRNVSDVLGREL